MESGVGVDSTMKTKGSFVRELILILQQSGQVGRVDE